MMYTLLGEKNVIIFDQEAPIQKISYEDFYDHYQGKNDCKIIIDKISVDFSLSSLKNCSFVDAYQAVQSERKILKPFEDIFLVGNHQYNILKSKDFFIQKNSITDPNLLNVINQNDGTLLVEHVIAEFCKNSVAIGKNTCWLYVAKHISTGIKIVAGIESGIILSRVLCDDEQNLAKVLMSTIRYLSRFGIKEEIKIISAIDGISVNGYETIFLDLKQIASKINLKNQEDIELMLIEFAQNNKNIRRVFVTENFLKAFIKNHAKKIYLLLWWVIAVSFGIFIKIDHDIAIQKNLISEIENTSRTLAGNKSKTFNVKINEENFLYIQSVINLLKESRDPIVAIKEAAAILCAQKIIADTVSLEKCELVKIRCKLSEKK